MSTSDSTLQTQFELGIALQRQGRLEDAIKLYRGVLQVAPGATLVHYNLGLAQHGLGQFEAAVQSFRIALTQQPGWAEARVNIANALQKLGRLAEAEQHCRQALQSSPNLTAAHANLGSVLSDLGRLDEALAAFRTVLQARPDDAKAYNDVGNLLKELGRLSEAEPLYHEALRREPANPHIHYNLSTLHLMAGRLAEGWDGFEHRWQLKGDRTARLPGPLWQGQPVADGVVLLYMEQGLGDAIQFCRYAPLAAARTPVVLAVSPALRRLMATLDPAVPVLASGDAQPDYAFQSPLMSLPRAFGTTLETIPASIPYLHADPAQVTAWRGRLAGLDGLRVGLVWAGSPDNPTNHRRSIPFPRLARLLDQPGVSFVSLQKDGTPAHPRLTDWTAELTDLTDTAALIAALDLVIGVDTAVIHLAGALGKPVWMLNRLDTDWRWMRERDDSPWYPTLRLFRQEAPGDWDGVIARAGQALDALQTRLTAAAALRQDDRLDEADALCAELLRETPHIARVHLELGLLRRRQGELDASVESLRTALRMQPGWPEALVEMSETLYWQRQFDEAERYCHEALSLPPHGFTVQAVINLGNIRHEQGRFEDAVALFRQALDDRPGDTEATNNLGNALKALGRLDEAEDAYRQTLQILPDHPRVRFNLGMLQLLAGRLAEGWEGFEDRWKTSPAGTWPVPGQIWRGEPIQDDELLVYMEQGLGDAIQFSRYMPLVAVRARATLLVRPEMQRLFAANLPEAIRVVSGDDVTVPPYIYHCPLMSLPRAFGTTLETIPADIPYLHADPAQVAAWRQRLARLEGLRVGVVWAGNAENVIDPARSIPFAVMAPLLDLPGVSIVSLQKDGTPAHPRLHDWTAELDDLTDTAALIDTLDLVIGVDTAVIHLAGAMGKPVWLLNRFDSDWRWMRERDDSPWYPTLRQFRQDRPGDWDAVIARVAQALRERAA